MKKENEELKRNPVDTGGPVRTSLLKPLLDIDKKDVEKPGKYKGDPVHWRHWILKLKAFLARHDDRWPKLITEIQEVSDKPLTERDVTAIFKKVGIDVTDEEGNTLANKFKLQFQEYLENFTEGPTKAMILGSDPESILEVFRLMCDEGYSKRDRHMRKEYRVVSSPKQATFDNLRQAIADWETSLAAYETASGHTMDLRTRILCLEDIYPDLLQQHLASKENLHTYANYKTAINDYLIERRRWVTAGARGRINWLGQAEKGVDDETRPTTRMSRRRTTRLARTFRI